MPRVKDYTVFCTDSRKNTIHIDAVKAATVQSAINKGRANCAYDWGCKREGVLVIGVVAGDINVVEWDDDGL